MSVLIPQSRRSSPISRRNSFEDAEIAWLAGLLEGEGSFMLGRSSAKGVTYHYPVIIVGMTDRDVIQKAADIFGSPVGQYNNGHCQDGGPRKTIYRTFLNGERAAHFMRALLPYMGERRSAKIREILEYEDQRPDANTLRRNWSSAKAAMRPRNNLGQLI